MSNLTLTQKINSAHASQECENIQAFHCYNHAASRSYEEWAYVWSHREDGTWGHAFGAMVGWDQIWFGNVAQYDANCYGNFIKLLKTYPEIGGMDPRPLLTVSMHTLANSIIEVAEDGLSCRASFYTPGVLASMLNDDGKPGGNALWERYGAVFVYEDEEWRFLHQQVCPDIGGSFDSVNLAHNSWITETSESDKEQEFGGYDRASDPLGYHIPPLAIPGPLQKDFSCVQPVQHTAPWPEPYKDEYDPAGFALPGRDICEMAKKQKEVK